MRNILFLCIFSIRLLSAQSYNIFSVATQEYFKEVNEWDDWTAYLNVDPGVCRFKLFEDGYMVEIRTEENSMTFFGTSITFDSKNGRWNIYKGIAKQNGTTIGNVEMHILDRTYSEYKSGNIIDGKISFFVDYSNTVFKEGGLFGMLLDGIDQFGLSIKTSIDEKEIEKIITAKYKAMTFGNLGWEYYKYGYLDHALSLSNKALALDNSLAYVQFNVALINLVKGDVSTIKQYLIAIDTLNFYLTGDDRIKLLGEVIEDVKTADLTYGPLVNASEVLDLLRKQLN